jgi:hypothetical protein
MIHRGAHLVEQTQPLVQGRPASFTPLRDGFTGHEFHRKVRPPVHAGTSVEHLIKGIIVGKGGTAEAYGYILSPQPAAIDGTGQGGRVELNP